MRILKGDYLEARHDFGGLSVLDVGFGTGNNLAFLGSLGMTLCGTEVDQSICDSTGAMLDAMGLQCDLRVGTNGAIPFADESFDYLVSWNVLHYEGDEQSIAAGIAEYARVLKPGGRMVLSTTAPQNQILDGARLLGDHIWQIHRDGDFRSGETYYFFESPEHLLGMFSQAFADVRIGRTTGDLFGRVLDWWLVSGSRIA